MPRAWNLGDDSPASMLGGVGWYRKDFTLPSAAAALQWVVRFESVNYTSKVWLNGRAVGSHRGAYLPFEFVLDGLDRTGTNHLVVRVDSRRARDDFPPAGINQAGAPAGGWWNYSGILREVYLRRVRTADFQQVIVRPELPCRGCAARVRDDRGRPQRDRRDALGDRRGPVRRPARRARHAAAPRPRDSARFAGAITLRNPRLWSPAPARALQGIARGARGRPARGRATGCTAGSSPSRSVPAGGCC